MKICVIGAGYVGIVTAAGFAEIGNDVTCVDLDSERVAALARGEVPIFEPGLDALVLGNVAAGRLRFTTDEAAAIADKPVVFVCVGTPPRPDGGANLSAVVAAAEAVAGHCRGETFLVLKSTVPVGTNSRVRKLALAAPHPVHVISNPEFLREGEAVQDFLRPNRIIIGCDADDLAAREMMARLYTPLSYDRDRLLWMSPASAELSKYATNAMLAARISFMNEIAGLCEKVGADVHQVRLGVGSDGRIGSSFLYAGPGYGGSCFHKDVQALIDTAREHGVALDMAIATHGVNERQKGLVFRKLKRHFDGDLRQRRIAVWGAAFKPRTDDIRESAAVAVIEALLVEGAEVALHDPEALEAASRRFEGRILCATDAYGAAEGADALLLMTEWRQYQCPDFERLRRIMRRPLVIDARNIWSRYRLEDQGFTYLGIGVRPS